MKGILPLLFATAALAISAHAQNATTTPVGAMTYTFPATTQITSKYISIPLTNSPAFSGAVSSFSTNSITFSGTPFTAGALTQAGSPYFLRFQSGAQAGRCILVTANTSDTVTVDVTDNSAQTTNLNTSGFSVAVDDRVQIIPGDTFASFFGDNTQGNSVWLTGTDGLYTNADTIAVFNKATSKFDVFYFKLSSGFWRPATGASVNVNNRIIYPESCVLITRRANRPLVSITVLGEVPTVAPSTKTTGGAAAVYSSNRYPVDLKLSQLSISGWTKKDLYFQGDNIAVYNTTNSKFDIYYQKLDGSWRRVGDNVSDQSNFVIPAGQGVLITKRGTVSSGTSFLTGALPYSL